jgi:copper homeostasis protein
MVTEHTERVRAGRPLLEVAVDSSEDAHAAARAGADRIELCAALERDGLTPDIGALRALRDHPAIRFVSMIRPRAGDFRYDERSASAMAAAIEVARASGAAGVVFGALTAEGVIDAALCARLVEAAGANLETVFHRAFDALADPFDGLERLIDLGFTRVLTSGGGACAADAACADRIARLVEAARGRIEILPGGGVRPGNAAELVRRTGCRAVHSSCRAPDVDGRAVFEVGMVGEMRSVLDGMR